MEHGDRADSGSIQWVVMPDHVHLLMATFDPSWRMPRLLKHLRGPFARDVIDRWKTLRAPTLHHITDDTGRARYWQRGGGYDRNIWSPAELAEKVRSIHQNPVRRGLVERAEDWRWTSAFSGSGPEEARYEARW